MKLKQYLTMEKPRAGSIVYYLDNGNMEVCLITSSNPIYGGPDPQLPKGTIENLSEEETAIKEAVEETGISKIDIIQVKYLYKDIIREDYYPPFYMSLYGIEVKTKKLNDHDFEVKSANWYTIENAKKLISKYQKKIFLEGLKKIN
jgi:8-oxo-dGTP pyrophosphatase MutT (NUDIX family)